MKAFWGKTTVAVGMTLGMTFAAAPLCAQGRDAELSDSGDSDAGVQYYEEKGFYFGAGVGIAKSNQDVEDFNDNFLTILDRNGFEISGDGGVAELEDSDTAFSLTAGYNFNQYLGTELSYFNFGTVEYRARAQVQQMGPNPLLTASSSADIETQGVALAGVGRLPINDAFAVRTKLGLIFAKSDIDLTTNLPSNAPASAGVTTRVSDSTNEANLFFSVGATYSLENRWTFSLDYEILKRTGDDRFLDDIGTVRLGFAFRL